MQQFHFLKSCANLSWVVHIGPNEYYARYTDPEKRYVEIECAYYVV